MAAKRKSILGATKALKNERQNNESNQSSVEASPTTKKPASTVDVLSRRSATKSRPAGALQMVHPSVCVMWEHADRSTEGLDEDSLMELGNSILRNKQVAPAVARPLTDDVRKKRGLGDDIRYEIIAGRRRYEACKLVKTELLVNIERLDDAAAFSVMVAENDDREDIKPFTRALSFKHAIDSGIYTSQSDLARNQERAHSVKAYDRTTISRMLKAASLSDREWLWDVLSQVDYSAVPIISSRQLESLLEEHKELESHLKTVISDMAGVDAPTLINRLLKESENFLAPPPPNKEDHSIVVGDHTVKIALGPKGAKLAITGGPIRKDNVDELLDSIKKHLAEAIK